MSIHHGHLVICIAPRAFGENVDASDGPPSVLDIDGEGTPMTNAHLAVI
jgi:hypothetical protein